jgi:hypothetical protein
VNRVLLDEHFLLKLCLMLLVSFADLFSLLLEPDVLLLRVFDLLLLNFVLLRDGHVFFFDCLNLSLLLIYLILELLNLLFEESDVLFKFNVLRLD